MRIRIQIAFLILLVTAFSLGTTKNSIHAENIKKKTCSGEKLLPAIWNPKQEGDKVLSRLVKVTASQVKGAHDAEMVLVGDRAYIVAEVNDQRAGEGAGWPFIYVAMSVVNIKTMSVETIIPVAKSEQVFANETLPVGACFVPRIIQKDHKSLRCYFFSENPGVRQSQGWYIDYDLKKQVFENMIHRVKIKTADGVFDMQPRYFYADAVKYGLTKEAKDYGFYIFDSFKVFDKEIYVTLNNWPGKQNALATLNKDLDTFGIIGHYNEPQNLGLSESSVNRLPDGTWMVICRQDGGNKNYLFTTSPDGKKWSKAEYCDFVPNGSSSKPTLDKFNGIYYLGWQESTKINGIDRSVFNIDISRDGQIWERKYRFETQESFQYPSFHQHKGAIWLVATQGVKKRIMFGKLE
ncbi:MAG: sialidase family protein [Mangrovibacterium sp.]